MSMDPKRATALILARMASSDGVIDFAERELLADLTGYPAYGDYMDTLLTEARAYPLEILIDQMDNYADRFFIAVRAYMMAQIDADFDIAEERFFSRLVTALEITEEDRVLIERTHRGIHRNEEPDPRIIALYEASTFATAEQN